jgi:hypothetical protein
MKRRRSKLARLETLLIRMNYLYASRKARGRSVTSLLRRVRPLSEAYLTLLHRAP